MISIITATYNSEKNIEETLKSVLCQSSIENVEWIFKDNHSTDNTVMIIRQYLPALSKRGIDVNIYSEHDIGIADAWNFGIKKAKGDIIGILNSDDTYGNNCIELVKRYFSLYKPDILFGNCTRLYEDKKQKKIGRWFLPLFYQWNFGFSHTTCFVKKEVYNQIGLFNTDYKIAFDYDFLIRALKNKLKFFRGSHTIFMKNGGISTTQLNVAEKEKMDILLKNGCSLQLVKAINSVQNIYKNIKFIK